MVFKEDYQALVWYLVYNYGYKDLHSNPSGAGNITLKALGFRPTPGAWINETDETKEEALPYKTKKRQLHCLPP